MGDGARLQGVTGFGPTALATPANAVTAARVLLLPFLVWALAAENDAPAFVLWVILGLTDTLDGILARRQGTTRSGAYLDPLADKAIVLTALVALGARDEIPWIAVLLIAAREIVISLWRSVLARRGVSVPASRGGKVKTVLQIVAVGFVIIDVWVVGLTLLWLAVFVSIATGAEYLWRSREVARAR